MMLWSDYRKIDHLALKRPFIWTYVRATKNIIIELGIRKYVTVTATVIFYQVYVTNHNFKKNEIIEVGY